MTQSTITIQERKRAEEFLAQTRDALLAEAGALTAEQWLFRPCSDRWSIAEILEHLVIVERRVQQRISDMLKPDAEPGPPSQTADQYIIDQVPLRTTKVQAPELIQPTGTWSGPEALKEFLAARQGTLELLTSQPRLRGWTFSHPLYGAWDGYQWILAAAAHSARHTDQIREVKADGTFPQGLSVMLAV